MARSRKTKIVIVNRVETIGVTSSQSKVLRNSIKPTTAPVFEFGSIGGFFFLTNCARAQRAATGDRQSPVAEKGDAEDQGCREKLT